MKKFILSVICIVVFPLLSIAEPRSTRDKVFSEDFMSESFTIPNEIRQKETTIKLTSPQADKELVTDKKRSIVKIDTPEKVADLPADLTGQIVKVIGKKGLQNYYVFANFSHNSPLKTDESEFYIAIIDKKAKIDHLAFQIEWFGGGAGAHAQVRMVFDKPLTIIPQDSSTHPEMTLADSEGRGDITYSLQAVKVQNDTKEWSPFAGLMGEYANALQFFSTQSKAKKQIIASVVQNFVIEGLTHTEKMNVFLKALDVSNAYQEESIYNTVYNSCITHALLALQAAIPSVDTSHFNPYSLGQSLRQAINLENKSRSTRLIINEDVPTANKEFAHLINEPPMTSARIKSTPAYQSIQPFMNILITTEFDSIIRDISLFIIEKKITYLEVESVLSDLKAGNKIESLARSQSTKILFERIVNQWNQYFPGKTIVEFTTPLEALQTQNI